MKDLIETIIQNKISSGFIFDTHSIIDYIIQNHSNTYLSSHKKNKQRSYIIV